MAPGEGSRLFPAPDLSHVGEHPPPMGRTLSPGSAERPNVGPRAERAIPEPCAGEHDARSRQSKVDVPKGRAAAHDIGFLLFAALHGNSDVARRSVACAHRLDFRTTLLFHVLRDRTLR